MKIEVDGAWMQRPTLPADQEQAFRIVRRADGVVGMVALACEQAFQVPAFRPTSGLVLDTLAAAVRADVADPHSAIVAGFQEVDDVLSRKTVQSEIFGIESPCAGALVGILEVSCFHAVWIGPNQAMLIRDSTIAARTTRHNVETFAREEGVIDQLPQNLYHIWSRTIAGHREYELPDRLERGWALEPGDRVALLSAKLADALSDEMILAVFDANPDAHEAAQALTWEASEVEGAIGMAAVVFACEEEDA